MQWNVEQIGGMADFNRECNNVIAHIKSKPVSKQLFHKDNKVDSNHVFFLCGNDKNYSESETVHFVDGIEKIKSDARNHGTLRYTQKMLTRISKIFNEAFGNINHVINHIQKVVNEEKMTKAQVTVLSWDAVYCQFVLDKKCGLEMETECMVSNSLMCNLQKQGASGIGCFKKSLKCAKMKVEVLFPET